MMADNLVRTAEDLANWQVQINWAYATDEDDLQVAGLAAYSVVNQANLVLRNIDRFAAAEPTRVNRIKGQALAQRAYAHFDVLRYWGRASTAILRRRAFRTLEAPDIDNKPTRLSVAETWSKLFADMEQAETLLGDVDQRPSTRPVRAASIDQLVVQAMLARMHLYAKNYAQAEPTPPGDRRQAAGYPGPVPQHLDGRGPQRGDLGSFFQRRRGIGHHRRTPGFHQPEPVPPVGVRRSPLRPRKRHSFPGLLYGPQLSGTPPPHSVEALRPALRRPGQFRGQSARQRGELESSPHRRKCT
jgi:hypothetical protein